MQYIRSHVKLNEIMDDQDVQYVICISRLFTIKNEYIQKYVFNMPKQRYACIKVFSGSILYCNKDMIILSKDHSKLFVRISYHHHKLLTCS